jgi:hypothetical protein
MTVGGFGLASQPPHHPGMDRRRFLLASLAGALAVPFAAGAQQTGSIAQEAGGTFRVGFVGVYDAGLAAPGLQRYQRRLRELGWVEG